MNKKNIVVLGFVLILLGTAFIQYKNNLPQKSTVVPIQTISVKQVITINGRRNQSTTQVKPGLTALQLLKFAHKVDLKGEKESAFVTGIDGRVTSTVNKEFWAFYVNGKQAEVGVGSYLVKNNDTIEWKIETY